MGIITGTLGSDSLRGTTGIDTILGLTGNDTIVGLDGADTIDGGDGNDTIYANTQSKWADSDLDVILAGSGDDKVYAGLGDAVNGGLGFDVLSLDLSTSGDGVSADFRAMTLLDLGGLVGIKLKGATLAGFEAIGTVVGSDHDDSIIIGNQAHYGSTVKAGDGNDSIRAGNGNDDLHGDGGNDRLVGAGGRDVLNGGDGKDVLFGGHGIDTLTGGAGADRFVFASEHDTTPGGRYADTITDFSHAEGDRIALGAIDAVAGTTVNDRFHYVGHDAFSGTAGELRSVVTNGHTYVFGDTDGDAKSDFAIQLTGEIDLVAKDFVL